MGKVEAGDKNIEKVESQCDLSKMDQAKWDRK